MLNQILFFLERCKCLFLTIIFLIIALMAAHAQQKQPKKTLRERIDEVIQGEQKVGILINQTAVLFHFTKDLIYSGQALAKVSQMNTQDYNRNVRAVKADTGNVNPAAKLKPKEITHPKIVQGKFTNLNWNPVAYFDSSLFPSAIIAMATYKKAIPESQPMLQAIQKPIGFHIISDKSNIPIRYEIECVDKKFFDKVSGYILYQEDKNKPTTYNYVDIPWNFTALLNNTTPTSISVHFRLFDEDGNVADSLRILTVRSINDCVSRFKKDTLNYLYAAYVQEEDPKIDDVLRQALDTKMIDQFVGYQFYNDDKNYVDKQVAAIWRVLHEQGFAYSSITTTTVDNYADGLQSQTVRTCDAALQKKQANCVDGSVLFASILRKIGIDPVLIICKEYNVKDVERLHPSGHCFLAYAIAPNASNLRDTAQFHFLETTMLNSDAIYKNGKAIEQFSSAKTVAAKNKIAKDLFSAAKFEGFLKFANQFSPELQQAVGQTIEIEDIIPISLYRQLVGSIPIN